MVQKLKPNAQKILNDIKNKKIFLLDGATGTYLQNHGLEPGGCPELMNKENPEIISSMAYIYFKNGSDIVLTNSFGGTKYRLRHYGLENEVYELNKQSAMLAKEEAEKALHEKDSKIDYAKAQVALAEAAAQLQTLQRLRKRSGR